MGRDTMKRVYESPVMMLEGFEANEYVAACWDIICDGCIVLPDGKRKPKPEYQHPHTGFLETVESDTEPVFGTKSVVCTGGVNEFVSYYNYNGTDHYIVSAVPTKDQRHPNASV